ncbi:TPA: YadA-like family protein [Stenotrophomonas maltophilia]|nr:YadA-like family protein [Stenotrophomonas maltophilia]
MNRIYRRVWSTARHCWVVASELTSPRGKPSSTAAGSVTACVLLASGGAVFNASGATFNESCNPLIADYYQCTPSWGHDDARIFTVIGRNARNSLVTGNGTEIDGAYSTLFGHRSRTFGDMNAVFGYNALASKGYSTAVGAYSRAEGVGAVAVGNDSRAYSQNSIAVGSGARTNDSTAGVSRIAIGGDAYAGTAGYSGAVAIGGNSRAEYNGVAIGHHAKATATGSVAIGINSEATESNSVSVGNSSTKRRVVNVADARLSTSSTDAVTGKQLHATNLNVTAATTTANAARTTANTAKTTADAALAKANVSSDLIGQTAANGSVLLGAGNTGTVLDVKNKNGGKRRIQNIENGVLSATSTDAATGQQVHATNQAVLNAALTADGVKAQIRSSAIALGANAEVKGEFATALGHFGIASGERAVAVGVRAQGSGAFAVAMGSGANASGDGSAAIGRESRAASQNSAAFGNDSQALGAGATAMGGLAQATQLGSTAVGDQALAWHAGSVALGSGSKTTSENQVSVGNAALKRRVVGVADGAVGAGSNEAVTGNQLHATNQSVTTARTTAASALAKANTVSGLVGQTAAAGNVRLGAENTGTVLDVRNKSNASRKISGVADATLSSTSTDAVSGRQLTATNSSVTAAQNAATAAQTTATAARTVADSALGKAAALEGLVGETSTSGNVRLGAQNTGTVLDVANKTGAKRRIYNIANGVLGAGSTDAVTGQQLFATNALVGGNADQLKVHAQQLLAQDGRIGDNRTDLDKLRDDVDNFDPDLDGVVSFSDDRSFVDLEGAQLKGVAAGDISSATSTDAVNGGQLFATNERVGKLENNHEYLSIGVDDLSTPAKAGIVGVALGDGAEASLSTEGATAVGAYATARGMNSVAIGRASHVKEDAEDGFALGGRSQVSVVGGVALGAESEVKSSATNSVALGYQSAALEANTVSLGNDKLRRRIVNVDRGRGVHDASTIGQLNEALSALGGGAALDGSGNLINPTYNIQGEVHSSVGGALSALDSAVLTADERVDTVQHQLRSVFQNTPSTRSDGLPQLNLAGANGMVLGNVANGMIAAGSRDAVNGGQLHAMQQRLDGRIDGIEQRIDDQPQAQGRRMASTDAPAEPTAPVTPDEQGSKASGTPTPASAGDTPTGKIASADGGKPAAAESPTPQVSTRDLEQMLERANQYTDQATAGIERRLEKMDKRFNRMAAMNSAQSAMAMNTAGLATYNRLGAGVGYSEGESAMAVGYQRVLNEKGSATFSLNGAFTNSGERSMGVGVGIGW